VARTDRQWIRDRLWAVALSVVSMVMNVCDVVRSMDQSSTCVVHLCLLPWRRLRKAGYNCKQSRRGACLRVHSFEIEAFVAVSCVRLWFWFRTTKFASSYLVLVGLIRASASL
jgi:hypothetical protein